MKLWICSKCGEAYDTEYEFEYHYCAFRRKSGDRFMNPEGGRKASKQTHKSKNKYSRKKKHKNDEY